MTVACILSMLSYNKVEEYTGERNTLRVFISA